MIQLYTGDGKGKTTAAVGQAVRAVGSGYRVMFCQFMKGGETGELEVLKELSQVEIYRCEREFPFFNAMTDRDKEEITEIHNAIIRNIIRRFDGLNNTGNISVNGSGAVGLMVVLDEITYPLNWGLIDVSLFKDLVGKMKALYNGRSGDSGEESLSRIELVLTGREPDRFILENADYITEMKKLRHPFDCGIQARKGIEY
jgi:cob(I)alamin adenosyltransferase